jgi:hypothetical protein
MPRIIITADDSGERVVHSERVTPADFETEHFRSQLAQRVAWAVEDAQREPVSDAGDRPLARADSAAARHAPAHAA